MDFKGISNNLDIEKAHISFPQLNITYVSSVKVTPKSKFFLRKSVTIS